MVNIEEIIADAKAEEEVAREQAETAAAAKEEKASEDFKDLLRERLKDALTSKNDDTKITLSLQEYVILRQKEQDLDRILSAIVDNLELGYNNDSLTLKNDRRVTETFRALYPEAYGALLAAELERTEREAKEGE